LPVKLGVGRELQGEVVGNVGETEGAKLGFGLGEDFHLYREWGEKALLRRKKGF